MLQSTRLTYIVRRERSMADVAWWARLRLRLPLPGLWALRPGPAASVCARHRNPNECWLGRAPDPPLKSSYINPKKRRLEELKARRDVRSTLIHTYAETYTDADVTGIASC